MPRSGTCPRASTPPSAGSTRTAATSCSASTRRASGCSGTPPRASTGRRTSIPRIPQGLPDEIIPIFGSDVWEKLTAAERARLRHHFQAWQLSQFLHGEQGALICTAKIVQQVPAIDAKFYAATQVIDEARHVEAYSRLLHEKFELVYPINRPEAAARRHADRLALGHDVPRHAGADRGRRARRVRD